MSAFRRIISGWIAVCILLSMLPMAAFAQETPAVISTEESPAPTEEIVVVPEETSAPTEAAEEPVLAPTEATGETTSVPAEEIPEEPQEETVSFDVMQAAATSSGTCGSNLTWVLDDSGTLTISGTGAMKDYASNSTAPWFADRLSIRAVVISDGVTTIGNYAFYYCNNLQTVSFGSGVTEIGYYAFNKCTALKTVVLPDGVKSIDSSAFSGCTALETVDLPDSVKNIYSAAFADCPSLWDITIPESATNLNINTFKNCVSLKSMVLPRGLTHIPYGFFYGCTSLESVSIPETVTSIGNNVFSDCKNLWDVSIPAGVTSIEYSAFQNCTSLTAIALPAGLASISSNLFAGCTGLTEIVIPRSVVAIGGSAFAGCTGLTSVTMYDGLVSIGSYAFANCTGLPGIPIPNTVSTIYDYAFSECTGLTGIILPSSLTNLGAFAFSGCTALSSVTFSDGLKTIGGGAFSGCTALESAVLPDSVITLDHSAFAGCTALQTAVLSANLEAIAYATFSGCTALPAITLPETIAYIGSSAFYNCDSLESVVIPGSVEYVDYDAFQYCDSLKTVEIREGVQEIRRDVFSGCNMLEQVSIPATVHTIGSNAFSSCPKLTAIQFGHLSSGTLSMESSAFYLSSYSSYKDVPTTVYVPYARDIHESIRSYEWNYYGREVRFESSGYLPASTITIDDHPAEIETGLELSFTATVDPWYTTSDLIWEVENGTGEAVITVDGVLTGTEPGFVTVICRSSDNAAVCDAVQIEIKQATGYVESITIRCDGDYEAEVELGRQVQMIADVQPGNAMNKSVSWEVENGTGTATITEDGVLTGLTCGKVTVYAMAKDGTEVMGSRMVEILRYVTDITICFNDQPEVSQLGVGEMAILSAIVEPEDASYPNVTWIVENGTGEATLSGNQIMGVAPGTVTLIVTSGDNRVTVTKEIEIVGEKLPFAVAGGNLYYNTVTGSIVDCDDTVSSANIPGIIDGTRITSITPGVFRDLDTLTSVTIPSSVERIGERAFHDCDNLASLRINGSGLKYIGREAFAYCGSLINLTIPESVTSIGHGAFYNLYGLKNLTLSGELDTTDWLSVNTLDSVTFTGSRVAPQRTEQYNNNGYHILTMPGRNAKKVILSDTITQIGEYAFYGKEVEEVVMGSGLATIGNYAFTSCENLLTLTVGPAVTSIGRSAFEYCYQLKEVVLPDGIKTLGERAFNRCYALESINLPDSLEEIGRYCFTLESDEARLQLIDLSGNPTQMSGRQMELTCTIPEVLVRGTGNRNEIWWSLLHTEENPRPYDIAGIDSETGMLFARGVGTVTVRCMDEYTGAMGTWDIEIATGVAIISEGEQTMVVSGETLQLYAVTMPGDEETEVMWSIREQDRDYATINSRGKVTAKAVTAAHQIEVIAQPYDGTEPAVMTLWIVPRTTGLYIYEGEGDVTGAEMDVDMAEISSMQFTAVAQPEGAMDDVQWVTSDEDIASVDDGLVTFNTPGTVTITAFANDGSGKSASVKLNVTFWDTARTLTATVDAANNTLQAGETAQMLVYGSDLETPLDIGLLEFGVPDSQSDIATVDHTGMITAGESAGTATITAVLRGDPMSRRVSVRITVIARQTEKLVLHAEAEEPAQVQMLDDSGNLTEDRDHAASYCVLLRKADVEDEAYQFVITPEAFNSAGSFQPEKTGLKWASSNTKIATVSVDADGTAVVTVKKGAGGSCVISAVTTDAAKVENRLTVNIRDYSPRLETLKPTLNTNLTIAAAIGLVPSYDNDIVEVSLWEDDEESQRLIPYYENGVLTIETAQYISSPSLSLVLKVTCADDVTYYFPIAAKVKNSAPTVTVKQTEKLNLFYTDSTAVVKIAAGDETIADVELAETDDFTMVEFDQETGEAVLCFSEDYIIDHSHKADTKAQLRITLDGYSQPVVKTLTIGTMTKKPTVQTSVKSSLVNTALSHERTAAFGFVLKGSTELLDLDYAQVDVAASFAEGWVHGNHLVLTLYGNSGGTATIYLQLENWMDPVKLTHKVSVESRVPTLKLGTTTLNLNSIFTEQSAATTAVLSQSNMAISDIRFVSTARQGTAARIEADKIALSYDPDSGNVIVETLDPENGPKAGSYVFNAYASLHNGTELSAVKIKVTVSASAPKVKVKTSTLKLNTFLFGEETAVSAVSLDKGDGYTLVGFQLPESFDTEVTPVEFDYVDGQLTAWLLDEEAAAKTHTVKLSPVVLDETTGQEEVLPTAVTVRVQVYRSERISVALASQGKLDMVNPNSEILYTVKKITNASGSVTGVSLEGPDADQFDAILNEDGTISLKLVPGGDYSTKQTYKVWFNFTICGQDVASGVQSFKVTQSTLKLVLSQSTSKLYQSQTIPMTVALTLTNPDGAALENISLGAKSNKTFLDAMGSGEMTVFIEEDGRSAVLEFDVQNPAALASGKTYILYLDVTAQGSGADAKPTQVKLTVKVER